MKTTIDAAGRVVIPKELRDAVGLVAGEVCVTRDGAAVRIEPLTTRGLVRRRGRLVIEADAALDDDAVRRLRLTDQR
ncbi:MAG TPA: MraZ N-terminal domain-containing protein [Coriobacteriia bacterium]|nr:MraZ N-terminal domain-containing protein [Coriobacteriia bacterium]